MCALILAGFLLLILWGLEAITTYLPTLGIPLYFIGVIASLVICYSLLNFEEVVERAPERQLAGLIKRPSTKGRIRMSASYHLKKLQREREERKKEIPVLPSFLEILSNGFALIITTIGFYIGCFSQFFRYWQYFFGGFTSGGNYWDWIRFCIPWLIDNSFWNLSQIFHWQISTIETTSFITQVLLWIFNIGLAALVISSMMSVVYRFMKDVFAVQKDRNSKRKT